MAEIDKYSIAEFGEAVAAEYMGGFKKAFKRLADFPRSGVAVPKLGKGLRCLVHKQHRIFYRAEEDVVVIIRIIHSKRETWLALRRAGR